MKSSPLAPCTRLLLTAAAATLLAACGPADHKAQAPVVVEIDRSTVCALDGMLLADYPGPKAQIHYQDKAEPEFFCDTVEMFSLYLKPEQVRGVRALYVQDMGKAEWDNPRGHWVDARSAWYVHGSSRKGSMGPTIASFGSEADAQKFAGEYGGKVYRFEGITADMVVLDGGALHDQRM
ncbi:nitrous oxide reductase accessory protein NosL [Azoarcus sp. TTM-91]|uniref:nitrous oxide reductase accessory protein NosL n=1 Tax=Azoarcus sp. TTM-91 TaxID=2691581 RepID=UPI00145DFD3C|nr:nitrous oxide reductase accessory protein NosL [Azoarcus sp. TTM-91]NMG35684.1 nitrous oxide reductase accessory protein NosL [Azoarcus sp. TTM-91]